MAQPQTVPFRDFLIYMGDGGNEEIFNRLPLAMNSRGFSQDVKSTTVTVPDLDNEDLLVAEQAIPSTIGRTLTGKGVVGVADFPAWHGLLGQVWDYRVMLKDLGWWQGPMIMDKCNITASRANIVEVDFSFTAADDMPFTKGNPPPVDKSKH